MCMIDITYKAHDGRVAATREVRSLPFYCADRQFLESQGAEEKFSFPTKDT